jgi:exopolysaccharide production protein ExoQ
MAQSPRNYRRASAPLSTQRSRLAAWVPDDKNSLLMAGVIWLLFMRVIVPGFFSYSTNDLEIAQEGAFANQIIWLSLLLIPIVLLRSRLKLAWKLTASLNGFFVAITLYSLASTLWSIDPGATTRAMFHLLTMYLACMAACLVGWQSKRFQLVLRPIITAMVVGSIIFGLVRPDLAISPPNAIMGETRAYWHGLANHKNALGSLASFGVIFWFHAWLFKESKWLPALCGIAASVPCLYLAGSSTSLLATLAAVTFLLIMQSTPNRLRRYLPYVITLFIIVIAIYGLSIMKIIPGLDALTVSLTSTVGKDTTFTGRIDIWEMVKAHIRLSPLLGTGYHAFWVGPYPTSPSYEFLERLYFYPGEAHEGYLDVINDLGFVGLMLLFGYLIGYLVLSIRLLKVDRSQALLYLALLFYALLSNLTESTWLSIGQNWLIFAFATVAMSRALLDQKLRQIFGDPTRLGSKPRTKSTPPDRSISLRS